MKAAPVWTSSRNKLYFTYQPEFYEVFEKIANIIHSTNCKKIGINTGRSAWEYPLWSLTREKINASNPKIFHIEVKNISGSSLKNEDKEKPCAVFQFIYDPLDASDTNKFVSKFVNKISKHPIYFYY